MVYESGKQLITTFGGDGPNTNKFAVVSAGGLCGLVSWAMICTSRLDPLPALDPNPPQNKNPQPRPPKLTRTTDPIDSAKSIYQRNALLHSKGEQVPAPRIEFFKSHMYRGLGVSMSRSCVVNAIFFSSFEFIKKHIKTMDDDPTTPTAAAI